MYCGGEGGKDFECSSVAGEVLIFSNVTFYSLLPQVLSYLVNMCCKSRRRILKKKSNMYLQIPVFSLLFPFSIGVCVGMCALLSPFTHFRLLFFFGRGRRRDGMLKVPQNWAPIGRGRPDVATIFHPLFFKEEEREKGEKLSMR